MHPSGQRGCEQSSTESVHFHRHLPLLICEVDGLSTFDKTLTKELSNVNL
jgi:hypothetical protein